MSDLDVRIVFRATDQGLTGVIHEVQQETQALEGALDQANQSTQNFSQGQSILIAHLGQSNETAAQTASQMSQYDQSLQTAQNSTSTATQGQQGLSQGIQEVGQQANSASQETDSFANSLGKGAIKAAKWVTSLAAATAAAALLAVTLNVGAIRELHVLAQTLDVSVQALTEWEYAAARMNVSGEKVGDIFKDVSDKLGDFITTGGGEATDIFENLNLNIKDLIELSPDKQLLAIGGALDEVGNRGQKVFFLESLANDASRLLPLLENDAALLKELQLEARVLGVSISDIDAEKVALAGQSFDRVKGVAKGIVNDLTVELAPILTFVSDQLVDAAVGAGGFRSAIKKAVDTGVSGIGFVLDVVQQLRVWLKYAEKGWVMIGQAGAGAMAAVADSTAKVVNTVMKPFQESIAWIIEKYRYLLDLGKEFGGPFADEFASASAQLKGYSADITRYQVSAEDIINLHKAMGQALTNTNAELTALIASDAPSEVIKAKVEALRIESDALAESQLRLSQANKKQTGTIDGQGKAAKKQKDVYAELVKTLKEEFELLGIESERARKIEINQRKLGAKATQAQREEIARLTGQIYDFEAAAKKATEAAKPWKDAWENATQRIDGVFASAWTGAFKSFGDFKGKLLGSFKQMLAEMAHQAITKQIVLNVTAGIGGALNIPGIQGNASANSAIANKGGFDIGSLTSLGGIRSLFTGNGIGTTFSRFATSGIGQSLGLSALETLPAGFVGPANLGLTGAGKFIGGGFSAGAGLGGLAAQLFGLGSGNALGNAAGGSLGAMVGNSLLPGVGGIIGSFLGTAVSGLFGDADGPPEYKFKAMRNDDALKQEKYYVDQNSAFGGILFHTGDAEDQDVPIANKMRPVVEQIAKLKQSIARTLSPDAIQKIADGIYQGGQKSEENIGRFGLASESHNAQASIGSFINQRLAVITKELSASVADVFNRSGKTGSDGLEYLSSLSQINAAFKNGGPLIDLFNGNLKSAVGFLNTIGGKSETLSQTFSRLQTAQQSYYDNFYSAEEKRKKVVDNAQKIMDAFNQSIGATGRAAINTRAEFRAYIESLDLTTVAGQKAAAAALALQGSLLVVADAGKAAAKTAPAWITTRAQSIADNYKKELALINKVYATRKQQLQAELSAAGKLRQAVANIRLSSISPLTADQRVNNAQTEFARLQVLVENNNLDAAGKVGGAAQRYLKELSTARGSDTYYVNEFNQVTDYLEKLGLKLGGRLDPLAELQRLEQSMLNEQRLLVSNSRAQLDLLAKQYTEISGLDNSLNALTQLLGTLPNQLKTALATLTTTPNTGAKNGGSTKQPAPSNYDFINKLYNSGLNRTADTAGFSYWMEQLGKGADRETLKKTFFQAAKQNKETNISYFAAGGVVTRPQNFAYDQEVSGNFSQNVGQRGEAGAEAIIPVGNGFIPAKFDSSLTDELKALRHQNAQQAHQLAQLNSSLIHLTAVTEKQGNSAEKQRNNLAKNIERSARKPVAVNV